MAHEDRSRAIIKLSWRNFDCEFFIILGAGDDNNLQIEGLSGYVDHDIINPFCGVEVGFVVFFKFLPLSICNPGGQSVFLSN